LNIKKKASDYYHGIQNYNCSQAVLKYQQVNYKIAEQKIQSFARYGGGRAEGGICGALYAALSLVNTTQQPLLKTKFEKKAGSSKCREIRKTGKVSCHTCVDVAANLLDQVNLLK
jgi:hypothetical protein